MSNRAPIGWPAVVARALSWLLFAARLLTRQRLAGAQAEHKATSERANERLRVAQDRARVAEQALDQLEAGLRAAPPARSCAEGAARSETTA